MFPLKIRQVRTAAAAIGLAVLAGCATPPLPPPPPPPPPPPVVIPPMPFPPLGAAAGMVIPATDDFGIRRTPNYRLTSVQTTWNLRSALNVAALNCMKPEHSEILPAYKLLLERHTRKFADTNKELGGAFRSIYGTAYRDTMDDYLTQVYNYFALPPVQKAFCDVALEVSNESLAIQPAELDAFAAVSMPRIEAVFDDFFRAYEAYLEELRKWNGLYGTPRVIVYSSPPPFTNPLRPEFDYQPVVTAGVQQPALSLPGETAPAAGLLLPSSNLSLEQPSIQLPAETLPGASVPVQGPIVQAQPGVSPTPDSITGEPYGPAEDPDEGGA